MSATRSFALGTSHRRWVTRVTGWFTGATGPPASSICSSWLVRWDWVYVVVLVCVTAIKQHQDLSELTRLKLCETTLSETSNTWTTLTPCGTALHCMYSDTVLHTVCTMCWTMQCAAKWLISSIKHTLSLVNEEPERRLWQRWDMNTPLLTKHRHCKCLDTHTHTHTLQQSIVGKFSFFLGPLGSYLAANGTAILAFTFLSLMQRLIGTTQGTKHNGRHVCLSLSHQHSTQQIIYCHRRSFSVAACDHFYSTAASGVSSCSI